jgi:hypothetical protein
LTKLNNVFMIWSGLIVSGMAKDHAWMYNGWSRNGRHSDDWIAKTKDFMDHVFSLSLTSTFRCPCRRHENSIFLNKERVSLDLCQFGFTRGTTAKGAYNDPPSWRLAIVADAGMPPLAPLPPCDACAAPQS